MSIHVLHVLDSWRPEAGSTAVALRGLIAALTAKSVNSSVYSAAGREPCAGDSPSGPKAEGLREMMAEVSVVHLHGWGDACTAAAVAARKAGRPFVITPLGTLCEGPYSSRHGWRHRVRKLLYENKALRSAARLLAINESERESLSLENGLSGASILPYGYSSDLITEPESTATDTASEQRGDRTLLILGPIHPVEGLVPFFKAFAESGSDNERWNVVLAGSDVDGYRDMLAAAVRRKGAADRVRFAPCPDEASQLAQLQRATLLACPSLHYRAPVSIMQALTCGVPVMASDRVAPDGLNTVADVCRPSRDDFRETLRVALRRTDDERDAMAARAREWFLERYDWRVLVDRYVQAYRDLA